MTWTLALLLASTAAPSPGSTTAVDLLKEVRDHYRSLASFTMRIEHQDSSGLFPGRYSQSLRWRRGGRFELLLTSRGNTRVPNYYADGRQVLSIRPGNSWSSEALVPDPNTAPGWEVSGGWILGWLQGTPSSQMLVDPPAGMRVEWRSGPHTTWRSRPARELVATFIHQPQEPGMSLSVFVDAKQPLLLGWEGPFNGKQAWVQYVDQRLNPPLPSSLGSGPASGQPSRPRREAPGPAGRSGIVRPASLGATMRVPPVVRTGQEWIYMGTAKTTPGNERAVQRFTASATVVGQGTAGLQVARSRRIEHAPFPPEAEAAWLATAGAGGSRPPGAIPQTSAIRLLDAVSLPIPFHPDLKPGEEWTTRAPFLGQGPPFPQSLAFRSRVMGEQRLGTRPCLRIMRELSGPLPLTAWVVPVLAYRELFWVDRRSGALLRYEGSMRLREGGPLATVTASMELHAVRSLSMDAVRQRREQARMLADAAALLADRSGAPSEARLTEVQARLRSFSTRYPHTVYAGAATALAQWTSILLGQQQQQRKQEENRAALVGKPAPTLTLPDLDGQEHTLGEYRGKLILLNVFASW
jgi:hypothetical protein